MTDQQITAQLIEQLLPFDFEKAYKLGQQQTQLIDAGGVTIAIVPQGMKVESLKDHFDEMLDKPRRFQQITEVGTAEDFVSYYNRYANDESSIFYDENGYFKAILDWHPSSTEPSFKDHILKFSSSSHKSWGAWIDNNNKKKTQEEFAFFIEDQIADFEDPIGDQMLAIASDLKATVGLNFKSQKLLHNGQNQFVYEEVIDGKAGPQGDFTIPKEFTIKIQPFKSSHAYLIKAWFRYRVTREGLQMWYSLRNPHLSKEDAIKDAAEIIKTGMEKGHIYRV
jgi:uncharacterized protein YfdQ (DUF2303 family)